MPNPAKPVERKRRTGNPGRRHLPNLARVIALPMADGPVEPLRPLGVEGRRTWDRIWSSGGSWISTTTDIELVQLCCEAMDERTALRVAVFRGADWRERVALRHLEQSILSMFSSLGFTPVDRTRMGVAEVQAVSKLEAIQARAAKR